MIVLSIKSCDRQQQIRCFECQLYEFDRVLNTLSLIAAAGNILLEVYLIEDGHRTYLPPLAFDGEDMAKPLRALQAQWEALLNQPVGQEPKVHPPTLLELVLDRIDQYETMMAEYEGSISKLEGMMVQADQHFREGADKDRLLLHYQGILRRHYQSMEKAQVERAKWLKKLTRLKPAYLL